MPGLKRLGPAAFLPGADLIELLAPAYEAIAAAALAAAGSDAALDGDLPADTGAPGAAFNRQGAWQIVERGTIGEEVFS